jgi:NADH-quinone oxidoreductase subunit M
MALLALLALPLIGVFGLLIFKSRWIAVALSALTVLMTVMIGSHPELLSFFTSISLPSFAVTPLGLLMLILTSVIVLAIVLASDDSPLFLAMVLGIQTALFGVFCAQNGLLFYIFWELTLIPAFFMILGWGTGDKVRIAIRFLLYNLVGSFALLTVILYLFLQTHSFAFTDWVAVPLPLASQVWVLIGLFVAFGIKLPLVPFHRWQPETYECLPRSGSMLFSGLLSKLGVYGMLILMVPLVPHALLVYRPIVLGIVVMSVLYASLVALAETGFKRIVATVSIAHGSLLAAGIFALTPMGIQGSIAQIVAHSLVVAALFLCEPRIRSRFYLGALFLIVLGSIGLPLTIGFIGEFLILLGISQFSLIYAGLAGISVILGAWAMLTLYQSVQSSTEGTYEFSFGEDIVVITLIAAIYILGIFPSVVLI